MRRGRHVGIAHAEIDDVVASRAGLRLELVDLLKHVWRQPPDSVEIAVHALVPLTPNQDAMPNGWAFEPQKRPPGQDAPSRSFAPYLPASAGLTDAVVVSSADPRRLACSFCRSAIAAFRSFGLRVFPSSLLEAS